MSDRYVIAGCSPWSRQVFVEAIRMVDNIAVTIDDKVAARQISEGEARPALYPNAPETLRAAARRHGSAVGFEAEEAFEPAGPLR